MQDDDKYYDVYEEKLPNAGALSFNLEVPKDLVNVDSLRMSHLVLAAPDRGFPKIGRLLIFIEKGQNLVDLDIGSESDPFVKCSFGGAEPQKSIVVQDNNNPVWNMNQDVQVASIHQVVRVKIYD